MKKAILFLAGLTVAFSAFADNSNKVWLRRDGKLINDSTQASKYALVYKEPSTIKVDIYNLNGGLIETCHYSAYSAVQRTREGLRKKYYQNGADSLVAYNTNNKYEGEYTVYYPDGATHSVRHYHKGTLEGSFKQFYPNGELRREEFYKNGTCTGGKLFDMDGNELPHQQYECPASFDGGMEGFAKVLKKHIKYSEKHYKDQEFGRVVITFTVDKEGNIKDVEIKESANEKLNKAAMKGMAQVAKKYKWAPPYQDGEHQNVLFTLPLNFNLPY